MTDSRPSAIGCENILFSLLSNPQGFSILLGVNTAQGRADTENLNEREENMWAIRVLSDKRFPTTVKLADGGTVNCKSVVEGDTLGNLAVNGDGFILDNVARSLEKIELHNDFQKENWWTAYDELKKRGVPCVWVYQ